MGFDFVQNDAGCKLLITFRRKTDGTVFDLSAATVELRWRASTGTLQTRAMDVVAPGTNGEAEYAFEAGELIPGRMVFEATVTAGALVLTTLDDIALSVAPRLT